MRPSLEIEDARGVRSNSTAPLGGVDKERRPYADGWEVEEAGEGCGGFVVSCVGPAELFEMAEHALDALVVPVAAKVPSHGFAATGFGRDDRQEALVGEQSPGLGGRYRHQGIDSAMIGSFPVSQDEAERVTLIVTAGVDLAGKAAA